MTRRDRRFQRQFDALARLVPALRRPLVLLRQDRWLAVRLPLAIIFILGGLFSFLPLLGIWMLPLGLLMLAVDLPFLRGPISALVIKGRVKLRNWRRDRQTEPVRKAGSHDPD